MGFVIVTRAVQTQHQLVKPLCKTYSIYPVVVPRSQTENAFILARSVLHGREFHYVQSQQINSFFVEIIVRQFHKKLGVEGVAGVGIKIELDLFFAG